MHIVEVLALALVTLVVLGVAVATILPSAPKPPEPPHKFKIDIYYDGVDLKVTVFKDPRCTIKEVKLQDEVVYPRRDALTAVSQTKLVVVLRNHPPPPTKLIVWLRVECEGVESNIPYAYRIK